MRSILWTGAALALLTGCAWRTQVERGTIFTTPADFDKCYEVDVNKTIEGSDRAHGIWLIPLGSPDAQQAVEKTVKDANANSTRKIVGMTDVNVKFRFLWLYLYSQRWYTIEGHPIYEAKQ